MNTAINLEKSMDNLYDSLIGRESVGKKALFVSFYAEFKTDKKVDVEPVDFCKFIFWKLRGGNGIEVFLSDDMLMEKLRNSPRSSGQKSMYLQISACTHFGQIVSARLRKMVEVISKDKKAIFSLAPIILGKIFVFDLERRQFVGNVNSFDLQCWEWDKDENKFSKFLTKEKNLAQFI